jgi:hypothetical protein
VEIFLNLAWIVMAAVMMGLWLHHSPSTGRVRRIQFVAVAMLILILFPIISVSDDLQTAQNLAEEDVYLRRVLTAACPHSAFPAVATLPQSVKIEIAFVYLHFHGFGHFEEPTLDNPALSSIQNRPPPAA